MKKELNPRKKLARQALNIVTTLIEMAQSHEIAAPEQAYGQQLDALERIGLHPAYVKVTTVTPFALGTIVQRSQ